ncbi:uncharacterized protein LOC141714580 [Apium graveolens]|uniref:uncharacterized protein LOC141714580 n=1 Tax=Apium graveolens TaxID=4045 RepID=UPI003D7AF389
MPNEQVGTIKVKDEVNEHFLYKASRTDKRKTPIQHLDEIVLTGPRETSISAKGPLTLIVDLFYGAYKDTFHIRDCPSNDWIEKCAPLEREITSQDGRGDVYIFYAIFDNATEARLEVKLLADNNITNEVCGVVASSSSKIKSLEYSSMLFVKKPSDKVKVGRSKLLPLSTNIVAVPLDSELFLDIHLKTSVEHVIFEDTFKFRAERAGTRKELKNGKNCKIQVKVIWGRRQS